MIYTQGTLSSHNKSIERSLLLLLLHQTLTQKTKPHHDSQRCQRLRQPRQDPPHTGPQMLRLPLSLQLHPPPHNPPSLGHTPTHKTKIHPPRRHRLRLQRQQPKPPHLQLPSHPLVSQPKRQDRRLLRQARCLCRLPQPANHTPYANPIHLSRPQRHQHLVPFYLRQQRSCLAQQRRIALTGSELRDRDAVDQSRWTGEMESWDFYFGEVPSLREMSSLHNLRYEEHWNWGRE